MVAFSRLIACAIGSLMLGGKVGAAPSCAEYPHSVSGFGEKRALSIPLRDLEAYINGSPLSQGATYDVRVVGSDIHIDVVSVPGEAIALTPLRTTWVIGRMASEDFDHLVLMDQGDSIFQIESSAMREIGCQFIWGVEEGENPIHLIRVFFDNLKWAESGRRVIPPLSGSLLGDTRAVLEFNNGPFIQDWVLTSVDAG